MLNSNLRQGAAHFYIAAIEASKGVTHSLSRFMREQLHFMNPPFGQSGIEMTARHDNRR
jgi:hypothetical protein